MDGSEPVILRWACHGNVTMRSTGTPSGIVHSYRVRALRTVACWAE